MCANRNILTDIGHRGPLEAKTGQLGGQKLLSFDPMTRQACNLACGDLLCANGNILTDIGHRGPLEAKIGQLGGQQLLSFDPYPNILIYPPY